MLTNKPQLPMHRLRWLRYIAIIIILSPLLLLWLTVSDSPLVLETKTLEAADTLGARNLASQTLSTLSEMSEPAVFIFTETNLNGLSAILSRGLPEFIGRANITEWGLVAAMTYALPYGRFLNIRLDLDPAPRGLAISQISVGALHIPSSLGLSILTQLGNFWLGDQQGDLILSSITKIQLSKDRLQIHINPPPGFEAAMERLTGRLNSLRD